MEEKDPKAHDLKATRRGYTCRKCGDYFADPEHATRTKCNPQLSAEHADDVEADAAHAPKRRRRGGTKKARKHAHASH